jgi:hypothetical protein
MLGVEGLIPAGWDPWISDLIRLGAALAVLATAARWMLRRFTAAVDERLEPVHRRIDEHMDEEEASLADYEARLAWLSGAVSAIAGSLGVPISAPPNPPATARRTR